LELEGDEDLFNVPAPNDPIFTAGEMEFHRSEFFIDGEGVRQFEAVNNPWLDLGTVYGDTQERNALLRAFENGLMLTYVPTGNGFNGEEFPPMNEQGMFLCGDIRCTENSMLFSWHTLFLREHNRLAREYLANNPGALDEEIYQNARIRNIMQYQSIIWDFYLPYLLGRNTFAELTGEYEYNPYLDPQTNLFFTGAVYRYGHSGVPAELNFLDGNGNEVFSPLQFRAAFENPGIITSDPRRIDSIFIGQASLVHDVLEQRVVDEIRDFLFTNVGFGIDGEGFDLISRNIQRARDHGLVSFNFYREAFGLEPYECNREIDCFRNLTGENEVAQQLLDLYGTFDNIDLWIAGMAEKNYKDSLLGETFTVAMAEQFNRIRNADRLWYENLTENFTDVQIPIRLVTILERNNLNVPFPDENAFMLDNPYIAWVENDLIQVEWFFDEDIRENIQSFTVEISGGGNTVTRQVPADELFHIESGLSPNTEYEFMVTANLNGMPNLNLGNIRQSTSNNRGGVNISGRTIGIIVGATVGGLAVIGVGIIGVVKISRRSSEADTPFL
jgi:hypothetical protein